MTDQSNVFSTQEPTQSGTPDATANPDLTALADQLKGITNVDGNPKYDTLPKAIDALANSQRHIPELQTKLDTVAAENLALKEKLAKAEAVEDVVTRLTQNQQEPQQGATPQVSGLDENAVVDLVNRLNSQNTAQVVAENNERLVNDSMLEKFGEKAGAVVASKAAELGISVEALQKQSRENPQLVLAAFGQQSSVPSQPTTGSVNIPANSPIVPERVQAPDRVLRTQAEQVAFLKQIRAEVYEEHGITEG